MDRLASFQRSKRRVGVRARRAVFD
jgi:hypothetical protein